MSQKLARLGSETGRPRSLTLTCHSRQKDLGQRQEDHYHSKITARPGSDTGRPRSLTFTADRMIWVRGRKTKVSKQKDLGQRQEDLLHLGHLQMTGRFGSETGRPRSLTFTAQKDLGWRQEDLGHTIVTANRNIWVRDKLGLGQTLQPKKKKTEVRGRKT